MSRVAIVGETERSQTRITRDTVGFVAEVSIRDLRNRGGDIVDRAAGGEPITITRAGEPVAELRPLGPRPISADSLIERWRHLPPVDRAAFRADIDATIDPAA